MSLKNDKLTFVEFVLVWTLEEGSVSNHYRERPADTFIGKTKVQNMREKQILRTKKKESIYRFSFKTNTPINNLLKT